ncbi:MAG: hypothetical protein EXS46_01245 [Candidatus Taylorbacteria bacterium]|nr:hypothetical protein [Candidatus Taylorbacteria bacterium]
MNQDEQPNFNKPQKRDDSLEELKKDLYSRRDYFSTRSRSQDMLKKHDSDVSKDWGDKELVIKGRSLPDPVKRMALLKKTFVISVIFFLVSVGVALYVFFGGGNIVSSNNVDITVVGPVSIAGGEILPLEIQVSNQNNIDLDNVDLVIDYPDGTRQAEDTTVSLRRYRESLGTIAKGESLVKKIQAVLFGEAGNTKEISISIEYHVKGSNNIFSKEKKYNTAINSSPVTITVTSVKEINANQETEFVVNVVSNATAVIQNLALSADYPFGFTFQSSDPTPTWSNSLWSLGDLKPGVKRVVKIRGTIAGQDGEDRNFRFSVGTENPANENVIGTNFLTSVQKITIKKPFIGVNLALDGDTSDTYTAKAGKSIRADLTLTNNVGAKITDIKVSVKPFGNIFNPESVTVGQGFYRSSDNVILWDQTLEPSLSVLNPDDTASISFSLSTFMEEQIRKMKSPEMNVEVVITGKRLNELGVSQDVTSRATRVIRVATTLGLSTRAIYYSGPFTNSGPIPPKANSETTYTIVWSLTNGSNDLSGVKVTAVLPSYVKWLYASVPAGEKITYNPIGGQILWEVGDLKAGTGFSGSPRQMSFQVSFTPSVTQVSTVPPIVNDVVASGSDDFVGQMLETSNRSPITTDLSTDISFKPGQEVVTK